MNNQKIAVYVPGTYNVSEPAPELRRQWTHPVARRLSELFGGATLTAGSGCWVSDTVGLVIEPITIVTTYTSAENLANLRQNVIALAREMRQAMKQEAIAVEIDGGMVFIAENPHELAKAG